MNNDPLPIVVVKVESPNFVQGYLPNPGKCWVKAAVSRKIWGECLEALINHPADILTVPVHPHDIASVWMLP